MTNPKVVFLETKERKDAAVREINRRGLRPYEKQENAFRVPWEEKTVRLDNYEGCRFFQRAEIENRISRVKARNIKKAWLERKSGSTTRAGEKGTRVNCLLPGEKEGENRRNPSNRGRHDHQEA